MREQSAVFAGRSLRPPRSRTWRQCFGGSLLLFAIVGLLVEGSAEAQDATDAIKLNEQIQKKTEELKELIKRAEELQNALRRAGELKRAEELKKKEPKKQIEQVSQEKAKEEREEAARRLPPVTLKGLVQGGWIRRLENAGEESRSEFLVREAQLSVEGSAFPGTSFFIEGSFSEPGEQVRLNDAIGTVDLSKELKLIVGQLRVPLNRPAVSARTALFLAEPRASGPVQAKARDRGVNLVFTPFEGRLLYEQALVNGNGIRANRLGNDDNDLLFEGRLVWFATGKWPLPLPAQTDLNNSPWNTFFKVGWASGEFDKSVTAELKERVRENTWNIGQAIVGRGLYTYWQYGQALADGKRDFDSSSFFVTSGYAFPLHRYLPFLQAAPIYVRDAWLEPKFQYETLRFADPTLFNRPNREIYRFGVNYYPFGIPNIRLMAEHEMVLRPTSSETFFLFLHYMF